MKGMSLIELMMVMALVGILASLGMASYSAYTTRVHRAEAQTFMLMVAGREEEYHLDTREYATLTALHLAVPDSMARYYSVELAPDNASQPPGYTLKAIPEPGLAAKGEPALELDHLGHSLPPELWQGMRP
ncbi:MAG: type IV pilin protein [Methylococcaceae bacterium]